MGRIFAVIAVILIGIGALGFYLDWWDITRTSHGDEVDITLNVDKNKIRKDTGAAVDQVRKVGEDIRDNTAQALDRNTIRGKAAAVDAVKGELTVAVDKAEPVTVHTTDKTVIKRNDETITLREVQVDQPVMVVFTIEDGKRLARSVTVETK